MKLLPLSLVLLLLALVLHGATSTSNNDNNGAVDMLDEGDILDEGFFDQEYFRDMSENDRRKLQDFPAYKTPKWWGRYKKMFGRKYIRRCNKWIIDHMEPPRSGSLYCPKFSGNYTCFFGEQKCEENGRRPQNHPDKQCTCVDKEWRCKDWSCPDPFFYTCPRTYDQLEKSNKKCLGNMKCSFKDSDAKCNCVDGEFVCTGGTSVAPKPPKVDAVHTECPEKPKAILKSNKCAGDLKCPYDTDGFGCNCVNGQFECEEIPKAPRAMPDDLPPFSIGLTVMMERCPADPFEQDYWQTQNCLGPLNCEYDSESCCGKKHPSFVCSCEAGGKMTCDYTYSCYRAFIACPDEYPPVKYALNPSFDPPPTSVTTGGGHADDSGIPPDDQLSPQTTIGGGGLDPVVVANTGPDPVLIATP